MAAQLVRGRRFHALFILVLLALLLRLAFIATFHGEVAFGPNAPHYEYEEIARNLAAGGGFNLSGPTALQTPVYPMLLAAFYWLGSDPSATLAFLTFQALLSCITVLLIYAMAVRFLAPQLALLAAAGAALYPLFVYYAGSLTPMTLSGVFLTATVAAWFWAVGSGQLWKTILAGILLGLTVLNDPVYLATVPVFLGWLWVQERNTPGARAGQKIAVIVGAVMLVLSPWLIRNYLTFGAFPLLKSQLGLALWRGNNPNSTGTDFYYRADQVTGRGTADGDTRAIADMREWLPEPFLDELHRLPELERDRKLLGLAISFIVENPGQALRLFLRKLAYFWWFAPIATDAQREEMRQYLWLHRATYGIVLALALLGLFRLRWRLRELILVPGVMAAVSVVYATTHVGINRYRAPLELLLLVLAAGVLPVQRRPRGEPTGFWRCSMSEWFAHRVLHGLSLLVRARRLLRRSSDLPSSPRRMLVVKLYGVGDTVLLLPALRLLRSTYPDARLVFLASRATATVVQDTPFLDALVVCDGRGVGALRWTGERLRAEAFDVAIDMEQSALTSAVLTWLSGATARIGFVPHEGHGRGAFYSCEVLFNDRQHMSRTFLDLLRPLRVRGEIRELEPLRLRTDETRQVEEFLAEMGPLTSRGLVGIQIGGNPKRLEERLWPLINFAELADALIERYGVTVIFTGSAEEAGLVRRAMALMEGEAISVAGRFSLREFAYLAGKLDVFISSDTGPMHIAAAMGTKVVALFGPDIPIRYGPLGEENVALYHPVPCSPCNNAHLRQVGGCPERTCLKLITVSDVLGVVENMLAQRVRGRL